MQKKTTTMTSGGSIRETLHAGGSDPSLPDLKTEPDHGLDKGNSNTLPHQNSRSSSESKSNGSTKSVKFSTLPSPNKGVTNNNHV